MTPEGSAFGGSVFPRPTRSNTPHRAILSLSALLVLPAASRSQAPAAQTQVQPFTVSGRVINAITGSAVPRVLVTLTNRMVLTDSLGHFEFPQYTQSSGNITLRKPGYVQQLDQADGLSAQQIADLTASLELKLYPDAIIAGSISGSDGQMLARVAVTLVRETVNDSRQRAQPAGFTQTDSHGAFRFETPPGRYRLHASMQGRAAEAGEVMVPVDYPEGGLAGVKNATFSLGSGEERRVDLQARVTASYPVTFRADSEAVRGGMQVLVTPSSGSSFSVFAQPARTPGEFHIDLPSGAYQVRAILRDRENMQEGESKVTVAGAPVEGIAMHFAPAPRLPVELIVDASSVASGQSQGSLAATPPTVNINQFNLSLQDLSSRGETAGGEVMLNTRADQPSLFQASTGTYRLHGQNSGTWYVRSATYGTTDLLTDHLVVAPGSGGQAIRIIASNQSGKVSGAVLMNGAASSGFIYLIAHQPSLTPVRMVRAANGTYSSNLPPGTYTLVAFDRSFPGDLTDPEVVSKLTGAQIAQVTDGGAATADLTVQPAGSQP
jgi:hypothetical protein